MISARTLRNYLIMGPALNSSDRCSATGYPAARSTKPLTTSMPLGLKFPQKISKNYGSDGLSHSKMSWFMRVIIIFHGDHNLGVTFYEELFSNFTGNFFRIWFLMDFPPNTRHPDKGTSITESHISTLKHCLLVTGGFKVEMAISTWYPQSKSFFKL